jgi:hypothetical protein
LPCFLLAVLLEVGSLLGRFSLALLLGFAPIFPLDLALAFTFVFFAAMAAIVSSHRA